MSNSWDDMRRAKEESYFDKKNREALDRLAQKKPDGKLLSPVTGEPLETVTLHGVNIDRDPSTGGVWLDAGELEQLLQIAHDQGVKESAEGAAQSWITSFLRTISSPTKKS